MALLSRMWFTSNEWPSVGYVADTTIPKLCSYIVCMDDTKTERLVNHIWIEYWYSLCDITFCRQEGPFVYYSLAGTVIESEGVLANVCKSLTVIEVPQSDSKRCCFTAVGKEYAQADYRWGVSDPVIVSLEILTVVVCSILCLLTMYAIIMEKPYRWVSSRLSFWPSACNCLHTHIHTHSHFWQVVLSTCELYGGTSSCVQYSTTSTLTVHITLPVCLFRLDDLLPRVADRQWEP